MNIQSRNAAAGGIGRRRFLELSAMALAGTLSRGALALTTGNDTPADLAEQLGEHNAQLLSAICERILPATDTPGAIAAGVPDFIANVLNTVYLEAERLAFTANLDALAAEVETTAGKTFTALDSAEQDEFLQRLESSADAPGADFFAELRQLTVYGYYTSEAGATTEHRLSNLMAPWNGDVPFADVGRMWSN